MGVIKNKQLELKSRRKNNPANFSVLSSAAFALTGLSTNVFSDVKGDFIFELKSHQYSEEERMDVDSSMFYIYAPLNDDIAIELTAFNEILSGASAQYVTNDGTQNIQVLSTASIQEERDTADLGIVYELGETNFSAIVGGGFSKEDDYRSKSHKVGIEFLSENKNSAYTLVSSQSDDEISIDDGETFSRERKTQSWLIGSTQILNQTMIWQSNISYSKGDGYFNDPYKYTSLIVGENEIRNYDVRPDSRQSYSWLNRIKIHHPDLNLTSSLDYRYYNDDWGINAHTFKAGLHYRFNDNWSVETSMRYYSQNAVDFYFYIVPNQIVIGNISTDHRLGAYGSITPTVKILYRRVDFIDISLSLQKYKQRDSFFLGDGDGNSLNRLDANIFSLDLKFVF